MEKKSILDVLTGDTELPWRVRKIIAFVLLLVADVLFCIPFSGWGNVFGLIPWYRTVWLAPDFITGLFAIAFVIPLYWRKVLYGNLSPFGIAIAVLTIFLTASYVKMLVTGGADDPVNFESSLRYFILFAVLLVSWAGLRFFAGLGYCVLFVSAIMNVIGVNGILGIWGFVIIVCTFIGIVLQTPFSLFGDFFSEVVDSYKKPVAKIRKDMKESVGKASSMSGGKMGDGES
jgi:hypothetical protein